MSEKSVIYRKREGELREYEKRVNSAAGELCLRDVSLLVKRGKLLQLARKKVADDGYVFKKGHSRSLVYGISREPTPKRPKYSHEMRDNRIEAIEEEIDDISRIMRFKEKRLTQAEAAKKYAICEQLTIELRDRKRELEIEKMQFVKKGKRALKRRAEKMVPEAEKDTESSDVDGDCPSTSTSRSVTPAPRPALHLRSPSFPSSPEFTSANSSRVQESPESPPDSVF